MRFVIVGAGALGSILGAHLSRADHEVTLVARGRRAEHVRANGLVITGLMNIATRCTVSTDPARLLPTDTLILATKAIDTAGTLAPLRQLELSCAFSVQNGVVKDRLLAETFGRERVLGCVADFSGELLPDGSVKFTRNVCLHLGGLDRSDSDSARELRTVLEAAGIRSAVAADVVQLEWSKFAGWIAQLPLAILTRRLTSEFLSDENAARVIVAGAREAKALADAEGITREDAAPLPVASIARANDDDAVRLVAEVGRRYRETAPEHRMSAQQDALRGSPLELEETLGYALERAAALGVPAPTLTTLYRTVRAAHPALRLAP
jgi:2-dehydropantoate 2-reductase